VLLGHAPNKAFLVPDSCRETERNGNNVSADVTDDTIETIRTTLVSNNLAVVLMKIFSITKLISCI
jgi:hypothetical protein